MMALNREKLVHGEMEIPPTVAAADSRSASRRVSRRRSFRRALSLPPCEVVQIVVTIERLRDVDFFTGRLQNGSSDATACGLVR